MFCVICCITEVHVDFCTGYCNFMSSISLKSLLCFERGKVPWQSEEYQIYWAWYGGDFLWLTYCKQIREYNEFRTQLRWVALACYFSSANFLAVCKLNELENMAFCGSDNQNKFTTIKCRPSKHRPSFLQRWINSTLGMLNVVTMTVS